ncbi:MAG: hypothetical protein IOC80_12555 [Rhodobacter sp.]|nr:hypothetical protein [Rhodobacter sp.]MCA3527122.1 hypothetical protein [Rhodobacter sp.]MCA3534262.1 hypothetical protein [Rhodobacter sp.]MCA3538585.1 hypothetical protein [Rhodobacter sp.]MCA3548097.1 hypothetical protein [Rhodobacter sp.]
MRPALPDMIAFVAANPVPNRSGLAGGIVLRRSPPGRCSGDLWRFPL